MQSSISSAKLGQWPEALAHYRAAQALRPDLATAEYNLATVLKKCGDAGAARGHYLRALELQSEYPAALAGLGALCQEQGRMDEARACYARVLAIDPENAEAHNNLGTWLQEHGARGQAFECYRRALMFDPGYAEAHNNLAVLLQDQDRIEEAAAGYRRALALDPAFAAAHKNLGALLQEQGDAEAAVACYREALRLRPDFSEARYKLAALTGQQVPAVAPADYVAALFDGYAEDFDAHLLGVLNYRAPHQLRAALTGRLPAARLAVLDLGCGTGLSGALFRDLAARLVGVDLSAKMLARARARAIYDQLIEGEAVTVLAGLDERFDLIVAADVLVYLGELAPLFAAVTRVLAPRGMFAFSIERHSAAGFTLRPSGRYAHGTAYIQELAARHRLTPEYQEEVVLRKDQGRDVAGGVLVLRAPG